MGTFFSAEDADSKPVSDQNDHKKKEPFVFGHKRNQNYGYFTASENDESIILLMKEDQVGAEPLANSVST